MPKGQIAEGNTRVAVILPEDIKEKALILATKDGRSLSNWIRTLITAEVTRRGVPDGVTSSIVVIDKENPNL